MNYNGRNCLVYYKNKLVWKGVREPSTKLWVLPLVPNTKPEHRPYQLPYEEEYAENAYQMTSKAAIIKYLHQCLFCPPKNTLIKVIKNNQLTTWPGLTAEAVEKYLPYQISLSKLPNKYNGRTMMRSFYFCGGRATAIAMRQL